MVLGFSDYEPKLKGDMSLHVDVELLPDETWPPALEPESWASGNQDLSWEKSILTWSSLLCAVSRLVFSLGCLQTELHSNPIRQKCWPPLSINAITDLSRKTTQIRHLIRSFLREEGRVAAGKPRHLKTPVELNTEGKRSEESDIFITNSITSPTKKKHAGVRCW